MLDDIIEAEAIGRRPQQLFWTRSRRLLAPMNARFGWWDDRETAVRKAAHMPIELWNSIPTIPTLAPRRASFCCCKIATKRRELCQASGQACAGLGRRGDLCLVRSRDVRISSGKRGAKRKGDDTKPKLSGLLFGPSRPRLPHVGAVGEAIETFKAYEARSPGFGLTDLVIIYQQHGQPQAARRAAERLLAARRDFTSPQG